MISASVAPLGAELNYLFMPEEYWQRLSDAQIERERKIADVMGETWANFIRTKRPMPRSAKPSQSFFSWLQVEKKSHLHNHLAFTSSGRQQFNGSSAAQYILPKEVYERWLDWSTKNLHETY